ncbi:hypothetical protein ACWD4O_23375 [Streptomyces sp. NPDC002623]
MSRSTPAGASQRVIVVLRDQHAGLPMHTKSAQRRRAVAEDQAPIVSRLKNGGATDVSGLSLVNAVGRPFDHAPR